MEGAATWLGVDLCRESGLAYESVEFAVISATFIAAIIMYKEHIINLRGHWYIQSSLMVRGDVSV